MMTRRAWALLACSALVAACIYDFDNPVASLPAGALTGRLVLQGAIAGQSLDGGTIKLAWSGLSVPLDPSGFFGFLDLPDGTYTLVYEIPGEPPFIGVLRDVVIPDVGGGADAVDLGEIQVSPDGIVIGTVVGGEDPMVVAVFDPLDGGGEQLDSQSFSTTTTDGGQFQLTVPPGDHILVASSAALSAEQPFTLSSAQTLPLSLTLAPSTDGGSGVVGSLIFGGPGFGASASAQVVSTLTQSLTASDFPPLGGTVALQQQVPRVGLPFAQSVRAGRPYDFVCTINAAQASPDGGDTFDPLSIKKLPVLAGRPTNLGPVPWLPRAVFAANDGGESSPIWINVAGSPALAAVEKGNSGGSSGTSGVGGGESCGSNEIPQDGGSVQALLALRGSDASHLLVWTDESGAVWYTDDQGGGFGTAQVVANDSVPTTLTGASDDAGNAVIAWAVQGGGVQLATGQADGGWAVSCPFDSGVALAVAGDGELLFATPDSSTLELVTDPDTGPTPLSAPPGTFTGVSELVATPCQIDVADGLCLVWIDAQGSLHAALADADAGVVDVPDGGPIATAAQFPSIASFVDPIAGTPYVVVAWVVSGNLQWGYVTSMIDTSQWTLQPVGVVTDGPALLLPWQGVPLAIYPTPGLTMATTTLPPGVVPSPVFPGQAVSLAPSGYADPDGTLNLGLIDPDGGAALFQLTP